MPGTTLRLPSSQGWVSIVSCGQRHYHLKPSRISFLWAWSPYSNFCWVIFFPAVASNRASQDCQIQGITTLCVISGNCKWQCSLLSLAPCISESVSARLPFIFFPFLNPRWGVSISHQPVFQRNYSVFVTLDASKVVRVMKTSWAISRPDYSGCLSVIKAWLSDAMGHLGIVDVLYAQVGDEWNLASTCSAWHVCTRSKRDCHSTLLLLNVVFSGLYWEVENKVQTICYCIQADFSGFCILLFCRLITF